MLATGCEGVNSIVAMKLMKASAWMPHIKTKGSVEVRSMAKDFHAL